MGAVGIARELLDRLLRSGSQEEEGAASPPDQHIPPIRLDLSTAGNVSRSSVSASPAKSIGPSFRMAIQIGTLDSVRLHLRASADVNAVDDKGRSPLILAALKGRADVCMLLLEEGADPGAINLVGNTAFVLARACRQLMRVR
jgi:ankyrin repeat protein